MRQDGYSRDVDPRARAGEQCHNKCDHTSETLTLFLAEVRKKGMFCSSAKLWPSASLTTTSFAGMSHLLPISTLHTERSANWWHHSQKQQERYSEASTPLKLVWNQLLTHLIDLPTPFRDGFKRLTVSNVIYKRDSLVNGATARE